ncbi:hypothetical protein JIN85_01275 [Luteolibacter pohnpeiensis]|uniref:Uncharacterized protein n=1 Tax=Luteolibacter pohnpeiensis TaxID=454153 RepID=A0A934S346_9BACT|nr:hypothetical protein [Luteolibacter pohnpeiensis]
MENWDPSLTNKIKELARFYVTDWVVFTGQETIGGSSAVRGFHGFSPSAKQMNLPFLVPNRSLAQA